MTEHEIKMLAEDEKILQAISDLKKDFIQAEAQFLEISDNDFLGLILLSPSVGVALANKTISFAEEMKLNKRARKASKGGFFLQKDPVVHAMKYLISGFDKWEDRFYDVVKVIINSCFGNKEKFQQFVKSSSSSGDFYKNLMTTPYILLRVVSTLFLDEDEDILKKRTVLSVESDKILEIGKKLDIADLPVFKQFFENLEIK
ncbi:MAG: hypothetical protein IIA88_03405 [Bacteroidetes bacterium]|nr:hypothetical protein [Bacteroidota bacterium]